MKKWPALTLTCISASLLCMLSADLYAEGLLNCTQNQKISANASPALRRAMQHACERSRVSTSCTKTADKRKLKPREREAFIARCEGRPKSSQTRHRRR